MASDKTAPDSDKAASDPDKSISSDHGWPRRWITFFLLCLSATIAFALLFDKSDRASLAFCLIVCVTLSIFWPLVEKVDNIKIGATGVELTKKVDDTSIVAAAANAKAIEAADKAYLAIDAIKRFVFNSMPQNTFANLQKIASDRFGPFRMNEGFRQQLRSLRDSGYIETHGVFISAIPSDGDDLSEYVSCTPIGREFIEQRKAAMKTGGTALLGGT